MSTSKSGWLMLTPLLAGVVACSGGAGSTPEAGSTGTPAPAASAGTTTGTPALPAQTTPAAAGEVSAPPSLQPGAAGACGRPVGADITFGTSGDGVPLPRCSYGSLSQGLVIDNTLPTGVEVRLSTGQRLNVPAGQRRRFAGTMRGLVGKIGRYTVRLGQSNAELLIDR